MNKSIDASRISLRLSKELFEEIDVVRKKRPGNISRNTWIAEAVREKLERTKKGSEE